MGIEVQKDKKLRLKIIFLEKIVTSPVFLIIFLVSCLVYYFVIEYIILSSSNGLFIVTVPTYLLYALVVTSALLLTISVYSIHLSFRYKINSLTEGAVSAVTVFFGSLVTSCGCSAPLLSVLLYSIGVNAIGVSGVISFLSYAQEPILIVMILINLIFIYYSLGKISSTCRIGKDGKISLKN